MPTGRASYDSASPFVGLGMRTSASYDCGKPRMHYVYILQSEADEQRFHTGLTDNLSTRLQTHNSGRVPHTARWKPWRLKTYIAFCERKNAADFER